jgi:predicted Zn-dependent protease
MNDIKTTSIPVKGIPMKTVRIAIITAVLCFLAMVCASCSEVAITGRSQLNLIPDSTMNATALTEYQQFLKDNKKSTNAADTAIVQRVGLRVSDAVERYCRQNGLANRVSGYNWEFNLIDSKELNAFAMPGGKVVVYTGILPVTQNETGLAVVIGHEIAHVIARHGSERMSQGLLVEMGGMALNEAMASKPAATKDLFMKSYGMGANLGFILPYSRMHESEADRMGLIFMAMAGFNPQEAVGFWQRMANQSGNNQKPPAFLSTHPADAARIDNIKKHLPEAMVYYQQQPGHVNQPVSVQPQRGNSSNSIIK